MSFCLPIRRALFRELLPLLLSFSSFCLAQAGESVTLAWDPNFEPDIAGYIVRYGTSSRNYTDTIDPGNVTSTTLTDLTPGSTYFFVVTAYNTDALESLPSNEINFTAALTPPPGPPQPPAAISALQRLPDGSVQFILTISANFTDTSAMRNQLDTPAMSIEFSDDLVNWTLLMDVPNPTGTMVVSDPDAALVDQRFYRIVTQ